MIIRFAVAVPLALAVMLTFGCRQRENALQEKQKNMMLAKMLGDALVSKTLLSEIREGRTTNAIEMLEFSIDCAVVQMHHLTNCDAASRLEIIQTLRSLKEYRQAYPRKVEAVIENGELEQNLKITEEANHFLNEMK